MQEKKIVFFGAGAEGIVSFLSLINAGVLVSYFLDNAPGKQGTKLHGIPVYHPNKLTQENNDDLLIIITAMDYSRIVRQLNNMGFYDIYASTYKDANEKISDISDGKIYYSGKSKIFNRFDVAKVSALFSDEASKELYSKIINKHTQGDPDFSDIYTKEPMYFNDIFREHITQDEIYVDAGVHTVNTVIDFIFYTKGKYKKIYTFEPDTTNYNRLKRDLPYIKNVDLYECGLSSFDGEVFFASAGNGGSSIISGEGHDPNEVAKIKVVKVDTFLKDTPTFIKMDIEGAEYDALIGAAETIKKYKPKLAVSVYHKYSDLLEIPLLIHEMVPEYKFYLRHHMPNSFETVLYAIV